MFYIINFIKIISLILVFVCIIDFIIEPIMVDPNSIIVDRPFRNSKKLKAIGLPNFVNILISPKKPYGQVNVYNHYPTISVNIRLNSLHSFIPP